MNINRSTIHCSGAKHRATKSNKLKLEFTVTAPLTIDSKLGWEANGRPNFHRAYHGPSSKSFYQVLEWSSYLLFRDFHTSGTAEVQAAAVIMSLEECPIVDGVVALCFDNTRQILSCLRPDATSLAMKVAFLVLSRL